MRRKTFTAVEKGAKFIFVVNPLVPYVNDFEKMIPTVFGTRVRRVSDMGLSAIANQTFRLIAHQRLHQSVEMWQEKYPGVDIVLVEPEPTDELMFGTPIMDYGHRLDIARHGFAGARIARIVKNAGSNPRMIYHYFGSKSALYIAVLENALGGLRSKELRLDIEHLDPLEGLLRLFDEIYDFIYLTLEADDVPRQPSTQPSEREASGEPVRWWSTVDVGEIAGRRQISNKGGRGCSIIGLESRGH